MVKIEDENIGPKGILWESLRGNNFFDLKVLWEFTMQYWLLP